VARSQTSIARRILGWPFRRLFDRRTVWIINAVDERLGSEDGTRPNVHARLDDMENWSRQTLAALGHDAARERGLHKPLSELDAATAAFLNWTGGPHGWASQAGVWFNEPVPVEYREGGAGVLLVNERVVEQPYVFAAVAAAEPAPLRILDVGGGESTVGLSLASLGHDVTVVDPRGLSLEHPRLRVLAKRIDEVEAGAGPFDVAVALSAIEHFGLEHYTGERGDERADVEAVRRMGELLAPGGRLVLTVPIGEPSVDDFQRVYDLAGVRALVDGWELEDLSVVRQVDRVTWERGDPADEEDRRRGVALVTARRVA
jgi:SAM-dependent methyltransferase